MEFRLKDRIFSFFTRYDKDNDPNKDPDGKGTLERFNEMLADDWDEQLIPLIKDILDNTMVPATMLDKFIPYLEMLVGLEPLVDDLEIRRKILKVIFPVNKVKGTYRGYEILFKILGFTNVIIEDVDLEYGFDSPVELDDIHRRFDRGYCRSCSYYRLTLEGPNEIDGEMLALIYNVVFMIEPINAKMLEIVYNDDTVEVNNFAIFVETNGDLIYEYDDGVTTDFELINGDLIIHDVEANKYYLDNGNLYKNER